MLAILILVGIAIHGVAALHFQPALNGLGAVTGRSIQAIVAISRLCDHTTTHAAAGIGITPAPARLSMQRQGLVDLGTGAVGDHRACTVNIADGRQDAGAGFQFQNTVHLQVGVGTAHGTVALNGAAHSDDTVVLNSGTAGNRQIISTAGIQCARLRGVTGSRSIVRVGEIRVACPHGGFSCGIGQHQGHTVGNGELSLAAVTKHGAAAGKGDGAAAACRGERLVKIGILFAIDFVNGRAGLHKFAGNGTVKLGGIFHCGVLIFKISNITAGICIYPTENLVTGSGLRGQGIGRGLANGAHADSIAIDILDFKGTVGAGRSKGDIRSHGLILDGSGLKLGGFAFLAACTGLIAGLDDNLKGAAGLHSNHAALNRTIADGTECTVGINCIGDLDPTSVSIGKGHGAFFTTIGCTTQAAICFICRSNFIGIVSDGNAVIVFTGNGDPVNRLIIDLQLSRIRSERQIGQTADKAYDCQDNNDILVTFFHIEPHISFLNPSHLSKNR